MIAGRSVLAIVPARGGSKGVPRKNLRELGGKPLIAWTIEAALGSDHIDRVILSSDDEEIMAAAARHGCEIPFRRPADLATDEADSMAVVMHALGALETRYDYVVLLQPTSPLREARDIDAALRLCDTSGAPSCVSLSPSEKSPHWMFTLDARAKLHKFMTAGMAPSRRQDSVPLFALNGAVYVARRGALETTRSFISEGTIGYVMPRERSLDIDDEFDLRLAGFLVSSRP